MNLITARQFGNRLIAPDRRQGYLRLELNGILFPLWPCRLPPAANRPHLTRWFKNRGPLLFRQLRGLGGYCERFGLVRELGVGATEQEVDTDGQRIGEIDEVLDGGFASPRSKCEMEGTGTSSVLPPRRVRQMSTEAVMLC